MAEDITEPCGTPSNTIPDISSEHEVQNDNTALPPLQVTNSNAKSRNSEYSPKYNGEAISKASLTSDKSEYKRKGSNLKVSFDSRTGFDATENLLNTRSDNYLIEKAPVVYDLLNRPTVDFRPQAYRPRPPKRNSQAATQPWKYATDKDEYYEEALRDRKEKMYLPRVLGPRPPPPYQFKAGYLPIDAHDDRMKQAGVTGHLQRDMYKMPQPHDFRGYPSLKALGLTEFTCSYERDPYNNKLHTRSQRTILGPPPEIVSRDIELGLFVKALRQPPKWEARLHHPHDPFPNRPASYTRYRRTGRDPHSAFMERVTDCLDAQWAKQRYETALQRHNRAAKA